MNDKGLKRKFDADGYAKRMNLDKKDWNAFLLIENREYRNCTRLIKRGRNDDEIERLF
jgi:hypothetical protein